MSLAPGTRLGSHEVVALLGAGGMGEVYRAHDTNLNRDVALKVLLDSVAGDQERITRFKREAHVLASLNHPHIAHIYGFATEVPANPEPQIPNPVGVGFLVMELVEGPTLADLIALGAGSEDPAYIRKNSIEIQPGQSVRTNDVAVRTGSDVGRVFRPGDAGMPLEQALPIARQIAEALEAAHEQGVVHRDLKPANIKVRDDGVVKVLDFGLAKALDPTVASGADVVNSPTLTARATQLGVILGTAAYMAPEQARGKAVDKRADVWAFGAVLYEMLTGERAFKGDDVSDTLAAVLRQEITLSALPATTPPRLARLIGRCLERDPKQRLRDIGEARIELARLEAGGADVLASPAATSAGASEAVVSGRNWRTFAVSAGAALGFAALAAAGAWFLKPAPVATDHVMRFSYALPDDQIFTRTGRRIIAIAPDGSKIAYVANTQLYLRPVGQLEAQPIPGTKEDPLDPVFSPDSQWIAYFVSGPNGSRGMLKKIAVSGGTSVPLCAADATYGISWRNGLIAFGQNSGKVFGILAVSDSGGSPRTLASVDPTLERAVQPQLLDDGTHLLWTLRPANETGDEGQIVVQQLGGAARTVLVTEGTHGQVLPTGHLVYIHNATIFAVAYDAKRLAVTSGAVPVVHGVRETSTTFAGHFGVSRNGTLAYVPGAYISGGEYTLAWVDAQGKERLVSEKTRTYTYPRLSPDGTRIVVVAIDEAHDVYVWNLATEVSTRLTFGSAQESDPLWMDDRRVIFASRDAAGRADILRRMADGTGALEALTTGGTGGRPQSISRDAKYLVYQRNGGTSIDLWLLPLASGSQPKPLLSDPSIDETAGEISPDGNWIAYLSNESGRNHVYVRPFPGVEGGSRWEVSSSEGGFNPAWSRSGRELYFVANSPYRMMRVAVQQGPTFNQSTPQLVFELSVWRDVLASGRRSWDIAADGRFLMNRTTADPANRIVVVSHLFDELRARMGVGGKDR